MIARHTLAPPGAGATIRTDAHVTALEQAALAASTTARPHRSKERLPPSAGAAAHAAALRTRQEGHAPANQADRGEAGVVDLSVYAAAAAGLNTLTPPPQPDTLNPMNETNTP